MKLIGENIHIISKNTRDAILNKDKVYIKNLAKKLLANGIDLLDLNVGLARDYMKNSIPWLIETINEDYDIPYSLDTTSFEEMEKGISSLKDASDCFINSTNANAKKLQKMGLLAKKYNSNIIALALDDDAKIPKEADLRAEIAFGVVEYLNTIGLENKKIFLDPLVIPIIVNQAQAQETIDTIRIFKEIFDPAVMTTVGLSNISSGLPQKSRSLINRVFAVLAMGAGLDSAIINGFDVELIRVIKMVESSSPVFDSDRLLIDLKRMIENFGNIEDISYNKEDKVQVEIYKTAQVLLGKKVYSLNYLDI